MLMWHWCVGNVSVIRLKLYHVAEINQRQPLRVQYIPHEEGDLLPIEPSWACVDDTILTSLQDELLHKLKRMSAK
jgi:hypothetical protein